MSKEEPPQVGPACYPGPYSVLGKKAKALGLALQGGGSHGAFTWGVLDKLLEDGRLEIEAITATSAGSMNAVVMAYGTALGGYDRAREKLTEFWKKIADAGSVFGPLKEGMFDDWFGGFGTQASYNFFDNMSRVFSPYQLNPFDFNPLRDVLEEVVDFDYMRQCNKAISLHINATNVRTGKVRVFHNDELTSDVILASACLPFLFKAVEIEGEYYWDGGYMGNPSMFPLVYHATCQDVLIVHLNPMYRDEVPITASDIYNRINEISFNSALLLELRSIAFVRKLIDEGRLEATDYRKLHIHAIKVDNIIRKLSVESKLNTDWDFLCDLRDEGRKAAAAWLTEHYDMVGKDSSIDIASEYL
jgi:NTE family protein